MVLALFLAPPMYQAPFTIHWPGFTREALMAGGHSPLHLVIGLAIGVAGFYVGLSIASWFFSNLDALVEELMLAYAQLWVLAALLLPVWVVWLIVKK